MPDNWTRGVLLDCETSGTDPARHQLLTLDAIVIRCVDGVTWAQTGDAFHGELESQPGAVWDPVALGINKISAADWKGISRATLVQELFSWVVETAGGGYNLVFGYNVGFDLDFVRPLLASQRLRWTDTFSFRRLDVLQLVQWARLRGALKTPDDSMRLADVAAALGIDASGAHRSADDVQITLKVMNRLLADAAQGKLFD